VGVKTVPTDEAEFVAKVREQIRFLKDQAYNYVHLHVYVCGIADPWEFGEADEFEGDGVLVVRVGPTKENENEGVPEYVFPLRQIVATELAISEE